MCFKSGLQRFMRKTYQRKLNRKMQMVEKIQKFSNNEKKSYESTLQ